MKRIHSITLKNFKAFQDADPIVLGNRNLLLYGENGSGKSSLSWALYTFLQSSLKKTADVTKYFDRTNKENLVNVHVPANPASITLTFKDTTDGALPDTPIQIAADRHETAIADIKKACKSSDFVTYRVLFQFYHFTNKQVIDLWPVFEHEMLPFCHTTLLPDVEDAWHTIKEKNPQEQVRKEKLKGVMATRIYDLFDDSITSFSVALDDVLTTISTTSQAFYNDHFRRPNQHELKFKIAATRKPSYDRKKHELIAPQIGLAVEYDGKNIPRPQSFLNEALLTQLALSIRFGVSKSHLDDSPIKLMVLDDLLISLDMSNRMKVVDIILGPAFAKYQKIILTHDKGFYSEIRRRIGSATGNWTFQRFHALNGEAPTLFEDHEHTTWATALMKQGRYDEAALQLRKAAEDFLRDFVKKAYSAEKFTSLSEMLEDARQQTDGLLLKNLFAVLEGWETAENVTLDRLLPPNMEDITGDATLSEEARQQLCRRRASLRSLVRDIHKRHRETGQILEQIEHIKDRILNPSAHAGETPLYQAEVEEAIELITKLRNCLP